MRIESGGRAQAKEADPGTLTIDHISSEKSQSSNSDGSAYGRGVSYAQLPRSPATSIDDRSLFAQAR